MGDRRRANPGAAPLLSAAEQAELRAALEGPVPDGGVWTCRAVADWIGEQVGRPVAEARGWDYLRRLGFSSQRPRPRSAGSVQKGGLADAVAAVAAAHPADAVAGWAEDEHRLGLLPVVRRVWAPVGARPTAWVDSPLRVAGRLRLRPAPYRPDLVVPAAHRQRRGRRPGPGRVRPRRGDRPRPAGGRRGGQRRLARRPGPARPRRCPPRLPAARLPELQPAERLWGLVDEPVANRAVADLAELTGVLVARCRALRRQRRRFKARTRYHWWPHERRPPYPT